MEIERKWLIKRENIPFDLSKADRYELEQAYVNFAPSIRIRKADDKVYMLNMKSDSIDGGRTRKEYEMKIDKEGYDILLKKIEGRVISKTRYVVTDGGYNYEMDFFHGEFEGLTYLEIEFDSAEDADAFSVPSWIGREVTYDHRFTNVALARDGITFADEL